MRFALILLAILFRGPMRFLLTLAMLFVTIFAGHIYLGFKEWEAKQPPQLSRFESRN